MTTGMVAMLWLALVAAPASRGRAQEMGPGVQEVRDCVERNLPKSGRQLVRLERSDPAGKMRSLEATAFWKPDAEDHARFLIRIEAPPDERGCAFLMLERDRGTDIWTYLPELRAVRRISPRAVSGSFFGTDFTYEDILELQQESEHARIERLPDADVDGRPVQVLSAVPAADSGSDYSRVVTLVDRETCVPLRTDLYGKAHELAKQVRVAWEDVGRQGGRWRPRKIVLRDFAKGTESRLIFGRGDWQMEVPDRLFHQSELTKGH